MKLHQYLVGPAAPHQRTVVLNTQELVYSPPLFVVPSLHHPRGAQFILLWRHTERRAFPFQYLPPYSDACSVPRMKYRLVEWPCRHTPKATQRPYRLPSLISPMRLRVSLLLVDRYSSLNLLGSSWKRSRPHKTGFFLCVDYSFPFFLLLLLPAYGNFFVKDSFRVWRGEPICYIRIPPPPLPLRCLPASRDELQLDVWGHQHYANYFRVIFREYLSLQADVVTLHITFTDCFAFVKAMLLRFF